MRFAFTGIFAGLLSALACGGAPAAKPLEITFDAVTRHAEIRYEGRPLLVYAAGTNQFKSYVKALYSWRGENVLRDAPADHLHHHGLMYAIRVNGINFWEETGEPGYQKHQQLVTSTQSTGGLPQVRLTETLHWVAGKDKDLRDSAAAALLIETRTLELSVDAAKQEVALVWRSDFVVGPGAPKAVLAGADYHGLGLRLPESFDRVAKHANPGGLPYPTAGKRDVLEVPWSSVSGVVEGKPLQLALFGHPNNPGPTKFFSMLEPFAYLSVTQGLDQTAREYEAGARFTLRYLLVIYAEVKPAAVLAGRNTEWVK